MADLTASLRREVDDKLDPRRHSLDHQYRNVRNHNHQYHNGTTVLYPQRKASLAELSNDHDSHRYSLSRSLLGDNNPLVQPRRASASSGSGFPLQPQLSHLAQYSTRRLSNAEVEDIKAKNMAAILVVTCPSGKVNAHLLPLLYRDGKFKLRLAAHSAHSKEKLAQQYPDAEIVTTDLTSLSECQALLRGATSVFHVGPSFHSREREMGFNMVDAAVLESNRQGNKFEHFVFCGVLATQHRRLMQHDLKSEIEERLYISPINWTILQPTNFMDAYPVAVLREQNRPIYESMWNPDIKNSKIALRDLAEVGAKVLNEGAIHYLAQYPLCSTMPTSHREVVDVISRAIERKVEVKRLSHEEGVDRLLHLLYGNKAGGASEGSGAHAGGDSDGNLADEGDPRADICRDMAERLILFSNRRGLVGSPNVLRMLLGREPTSIEEWVRLQMKMS